MNWMIVEDDDGLPHFAWANQNIAIVTVLLRGLLEPATPRDRRVHREIRRLLERAAVQQAKRSLSQ
jgi:hypothetical protein